MPSRRGRRAVAGAVLSVLLAGFGGACGGTSSPAAKVNGVEITQATLDEELEAIRDNEEYLKLIEDSGTAVKGKGAGTFDAAFVAQVLSRQILLELVHQDVVKRKLELDDAALKDAEEEVKAQIQSDKAFEAFEEDYRELLIRRNAEITVLQADVGDVDTSDAAIAAFYEENKENYSTICVRHILVPDKAKADALRAQIAAGGDFATLAKENSTDEGSGAQGGELSSEPGKCLTNEEASQFVPEFLEAMDKLQPGELSQPVQTQFGFHLIQVRERGTLPLEEVAEDIRSRLLQSSGNALFEHVQKLVDDADVTVNKRYGRFEPCGKEKRDAGECQQPGVIPPEAPDLPTTTTTAPGGGLGVPLPGGGSAPPIEGPPAEAEPQG